MNNKSIVRQLKIDLITDTPNDIIVWFNDLWSKLHVMEPDVYHKKGSEFIYYKIIGGKKEWIFYRDDENDTFFCNYTHFWSILENNFDYEYYLIQGITKVLVENTLNNSVTSPQFLLPSNQIRIYNALNNTNDVVIATPYHLDIESSKQISDALDPKQNE